MIRIFTLLAFTILTIGQGFSQNHVNYERDSRWFIGLNAGGTWTTQTEVPYRVRGGYGFTFGKSFGMEEDKIFSWDVRARFLHAWFQGQATNRYNLDSTSMLSMGHYGPALNTYRDSLGYFIPNYRSNLLSGSLELVLNTNRLRQNTGWNLSVFGGIGIKGYHVASNLVENDLFEDGEIYDYDQLNSTSQSNLISFQDDDFETDIVGDAFNWEADWMPSFGFGISKQLAPYFALGLEHKITWTRTNMFDGMPNNFDGTPSTDNDIYHYTALTAKFHLFDGKREELTEEPDDILEEDPIPDPIIDEPVRRKKPIVDIYDPNQSPHETTSGRFRIRANVYYVDGKSNITFKQDGNINSNFTYNSSTDQFESNVVLHAGQNLFEITGTNESGSDYESVIIIYEKELEPQNPPIVTITNPPYTPYTSNSNIFGLVSTVLNVDMKSQIRVYLNGVNLNAFSYDNSAKVVNASLNLREGVNTVTVTATNNAGSDSKTVEIIFERQIKTPPPVVRFVNPNVDPYETTVSTIGIRATALHVATKSDLTVKVNGNSISSFSFNASTKEIYFNTNLVEGANIIEIAGVNSAGYDVASTTIIYARAQTPKPPIVTFIDPDLDPITVYTSSYNVTAKVEHVASAANITLKINGIPSALFTYSTSSDLMNFSTGLVEGSNVIEIKGTNEFGDDLETTTIIYRKTLPQAPPIVDITYPSVDNVVFESPEIVVVASVLNVSNPADISVLINGSATIDFTYNISTKILNLPMVLEEGNNVVQITGTNMSGADSKTRIIKYKKPIVPCPPTVDFINPPSSPHLVDVAAFTLTANTTHIDSKSQIVLKQNGELIPDALYTLTAGHQIIYNATLIAGSNVFEVRVENADGSDDDLAVINLKEDNQPCIIPTVGYISPVPYSTVDNAAVTIDAQINNHSPGTTVELKLNGLSLGYMTYNAETSIASKGITLLEGSNAINVVVTNDCGTNQATFTLVYEVADAPCDDPTLTASGLTTFSTLEEEISVNLTANEVANASELTVKLNGTEIPFAFDSGTGSVTIAGVNLTIGINTLTVSAKTDCGGAVLTYTITRDECKIPVISGISPTDGSATEAESIVLTANVMNATAEEIIVLLNGVSQAFSFNAETHTLSEALPLEEGLNTIEIRGENACGSVVKTITITREIPCESIITNLLSPAVSPIISPEGTYTIVLHATGLTSVEQITATLNGDAVTPTFDVVSGNITLTDLALVDGDNMVVITMGNECSESVVSYVVTYNGCEAPVVIINGIVPGMTVAEGVFSLAAVVTNVSNASDIVLKVNGETTDFDFNPVTHLLTAEVPLVEGTNVFNIEANGCEKTTATASVVYAMPCEKITHSLMTPNTTPTVSIESEFEITLSTFAVESAAQITVTLNSVAIPFEFNDETGIITISGIDLIDGTNTVIVSMENECSSDLVNYSIIYDGCEEPLITFGSNPLEVTDAEYSFGATVMNVSNAESIQVFLNDAPVPFVFDAASGALDATVSLAEGDNVIRIVANGCVSKTEDFTVNYTEPCVAITYSLGMPAELEVEWADDTYSIDLVVQHASLEGVSVTLGGETIPFTYTDNIVSIYGIVLEDGSNTVVVNVSNQCSSETITYSILHEDCSTPVIDMTTNPISTSAAIYPFTATVTNIAAADEVQLFLNDVSVPFGFDVASGTITASLTLVEGTNSIKVRANGCDLEIDKMEVFYTVPCNVVTYSLVSPSTLISETDEGSIGFTLNTTDVVPESISVMLNGEVIAHDFAGGVISIASVPLIEGTNALAITFGNNCSEETVAYTIEHDHCETPSIIINGITDGMVLTEEDLVLFAIVNNVEDVSEITVLFNGVGVPFEFNAMSKVLQVSLKLIEGSNSIEILVNGCESASAGISVVYDVPCAAPTYTLVAPTETIITVEGDTYNVSLTAENVTEEQITVKVNGTSIAFTYSGGAILFDVPYISVPTNSVVVTLENECGTVEVSYTITYILEEEDCEPEVSATFGDGNNSVSVSSDMDLINIILNLDDGSTMVIESVSGTSGTFVPTAPFDNNCIIGVWIRSGCNMSDAGEPYGEYIANDAWDGVCEDANPCTPITYSFISPSRLDYATDVSPYSINFVASHVEEASDITVKVNGVEKTASFDGTNVSLAGIVLTQGVNTVEFTLKNECSTEIVKYNISYVTFIGKDGDVEKPAPVISLMNPIKTNIKVKEETISLKAKVTNVSGKVDIKVNVNGTDLSRFNYSIGSKQLSAVIKLKPGVNLVKITASNGKKVDLTYNITYEKPSNNTGDNTGNTSNVGAVTPKLERVSPKVSVSTIQSSTYVVETKATNITSKADLTMKVNGVKITNFSFSSSTKIMSATVKLKEGRNDILVEAVNGDKKAKVSYVITYKKVSGQVSGNTGNTSQVGVKTPKLERVSPKVSVSTTESSTYVVKTKATNITSKADLTMKVNGVKITNFSFSSSTKIMSAAVKLKEGRNDILIEAVNGDKKAKVTYIITYKKLSGQVSGNTGNTNGNTSQVGVKTPKLERISPSISTSTSQASTYIVKTRAINVSSKANLTMKVNGAKITNFSFSSSTKVMSATVKLKEGRNDILIEANNSGRKAKLTYVITYKKLGGQVQNSGNNGSGVSGSVKTVKKPEFKMMNPLRTTATVKTQSFALRTKVLNVKSKKDVTITINGVKVSAFTFNSSTGEIIANLKLKSGNNSIRISAKNGSQIATISYTIKYEAEPIKGGVVKPGGDGEKTGTSGTIRRGG